MRRSIPLALGMAVSVAASGFAQARDGAPMLRDLAAESDVVFRGVVQNIEYRLSEPSGPEHVRVPHTFVTYRVDDVLLGDEPGATVTLRFIGGLNLEKRRYMASSHAPQFDLGDEDILFVTGNGSRQCPLVRNREGRLRVIGDQVYSETGRAVKIAESGALELGDRYRLEEVTTTHAFGRAFARSFGSGAIEGPSDAIGADLLAERITQLAVARPGAVFVDADPSVPFAGPDMTAAAPPTLGPSEERDPIEPAEAALIRERESERPLKKQK